MFKFLGNNPFKLNPKKQPITKPSVSNPSNKPVIEDKKKNPDDVVINFDDNKSDASETPVDKETPLLQALKSGLENTELQKKPTTTTTTPPLTATATTPPKINPAEINTKSTNIITSLDNVRVNYACKINTNNFDSKYNYDDLDITDIEFDFLTTYTPQIFMFFFKTDYTLRDNFTYDETRKLMGKNDVNKFLNDLMLRALNFVKDLNETNLTSYDIYKAKYNNIQPKIRYIIDKLPLAHGYEVKKRYDNNEFKSIYIYITNITIDGTVVHIGFIKIVSFIFINLSDTFENLQNFLNKYIFINSIVQIKNKPTTQIEDKPTTPPPPPTTTPTTATATTPKPPKINPAKIDKTTSTNIITSLDDVDVKYACKINTNTFGSKYYNYDDLDITDIEFNFLTIYSPQIFMFFFKKDYTLRDNFTDDETRKLMDKNDVNKFLNKLMLRTLNFVKDLDKTEDLANLKNYDNYKTKYNNIQPKITYIIDSLPISHLYVKRFDKYEDTLIYIYITNITIDGTVVHIGFIQLGSFTFINLSDTFENLQSFLKTHIFSKSISKPSQIPPVTQEDLKALDLNTDNIPISNPSRRPPLTKEDLEALKLKIGGYKTKNKTKNKKQNKSKTKKQNKSKTKIKKQNKSKSKTKTKKQSKSNNKTK
jgi:hypothetical protein